MRGVGAGSLPHRSRGTREARAFPARRAIETPRSRSLRLARAQSGGSDFQAVLWPIIGPSVNFLAPPRFAGPYGPAGLLPLQGATLDGASVALAVIGYGIELEGTHACSGVGTAVTPLGRKRDP
jgi:hypothetical protein